MAWELKTNARRHSEVDIVQVTEDNLLAMAGAICPGDEVEVSPVDFYDESGRCEGSKWLTYVRRHGETNDYIHMDEDILGLFEATEANGTFYYEEMDHSVYSFLFWLVVKHADDCMTEKWFQRLFYYGQTYKIRLIRDNGKEVGTILRRPRDANEAEGYKLPLTVGANEEFVFTPHGSDKGQVIFTTHLL